MKKKIQFFHKTRARVIQRKALKKAQRKTRSKQTSSTGRPKKLGAAEIIYAPLEFSIYELAEGDTQKYSEAIDFIEKIKSIDHSKSYIIDFSNTERVTAAALLLLYATIDQKKVTGPVNSSIVWPHSDSARRVIVKSGLNKLLQNTLNTEEPDFSNTIISGVGNDKVESLIDHIEQSVYKNQMDDEVEYLYGDAISETINNVGRHAYPESNASDKKWWILCDVIGDKLFVLIYDCGIGIPKTVVKRNWFISSVEKFYPEQYAEAKQAPASQSKLYFFGSLKDENLIDLAMKQDVTGTLKSKHGQGSKSIKALVSETHRGKLWIYSNKGLLTFKNVDTPVDLHTLNKGFPGTLVQWNIKIS
ncbi:hypothetical protein [Shewanella pealeana]|uniref:Uncharacterized protein n=1 Tax=Shewanella pealeana (strain ATCC 700345 / ANG-SQ1) TaxID=398579 RepID=A8H8W0_SHEPA|nr:hypothetical protein [Shewanella pealeana]ABV88997.1 conserved hypothetical protein [Shewanella pealeana ATCC 700345]